MRPEEVAPCEVWKGDAVVAGQDVPDMAARRQGHSMKKLTLRRLKPIIAMNA